jgi:sugar phosphate isomerase/epimerase
VLGVEPLNRFETSVLNLTADAITVVDRVGHPSCGLLLDTFHMNIEEQSIGDALRSAGSRLKHLHACENDRGAPGSGHVPWTEVAQALRDIRYNDGVVIESFTSKVKSIARAAAIWRPLAATRNALAENGCGICEGCWGRHARHGRCAPAGAAEGLGPPDLSVVRAGGHGPLSDGGLRGPGRSPPV